MRKYIIIAAGAFTLCACGLYNKYEAPELPETPLVGDIVAVPDTAAVPVPAWEELFTDPTLQALINQALVQNSDLRIAALNVEQAQRSLNVSKMAYAPSFNLGVEGTATSFKLDKAALGFNTPLQASWEIDLFGKLRNQMKQASSGLEMTKEYVQLIRTQIISGVAANYYALVLADEQLRITQSNLEVMSQSLEAMKAMVEVGMGNQTAVLQLSANVREVSNAMLDMQQNVALTENNLNLLLNQSPQHIKRASINDINLIGGLKETISLAALSNRPDVRVAEYELAKSFYGVSYARAKLYPSLRLSGQAGWTNNIGQIVNPANLLLSALGSITQPLFNAGVNRANLSNAKSQYEQQLIRFEKSLLVAGKEVNDAIIKKQTGDAQLEDSGKRIEELTQAVEQTEELMTAGMANYLEVLTAQNSKLAAELSYAGLWYGKAVSEINLYKALGGGRTAETEQEK